jgi:hypothetical protein
MHVPPGARVLLRLGAWEVEFEPMRAGADGRPTLGLRAAGANRGIWLRIPKAPTSTSSSYACSNSRRRTARFRTHLGISDPAQNLKSNESHTRKSSPSSGPMRMSRSPTSSVPRSTPTSSWTGALPAHRKSVTTACGGACANGTNAAFELPALKTHEHAVPLLRPCIRRFWSCWTAAAVFLSASISRTDFPQGSRGHSDLGTTPWRGVWDEITGRIKDDQDNHWNNRFNIANHLNREVGTAPGPFWGHPHGQRFTHLFPTSPHYPVRDLARLRITERHAPTAQPTWKLYGNGSVGSQALLGIPCVAVMREDPAFRELSAVWPFETGCMLPPRTGRPRIIHAKIYPSLVGLRTDLGGRVKDRAQVEAIAQYLARHDANEV